MGESPRDNARRVKNGMTNRQINGNTCISRVLFGETVHSLSSHAGPTFVLDKTAGRSRMNDN